MNLDTVPRKTLIALIKSQQKRIEELEKRIAQLERKTPPGLPFHPKPSIKLKRKKKRRKRGQGYARKLDRPTHVVKHAYSNCPNCKGKLYQGWLKRRRQIIDIPLTPATITEHQIFEHWCHSCKSKVSPKPDFTSHVLGKHRVSMRLMSYIAVLREQERKPFREIQSHLKTFFHLTLSLGEIIEICHTVANKALPVYKDLGKDILLSPVVHADETGWREDGVNGYIWNFNTPKIKYLVYKKTRSKQVVKEVIGKEFEGVLVTDFYTAYNTHLGYHQRCWVHLMRDIKKLTENNPRNKKLGIWARKIKRLYKKAKDYPGPDPGKYPNITAQQRKRWHDAVIFRNKLLAICRPYINQDVPMKTLCQRIDKYQDELFLFIANPNVPSDNNSAERSLRHSVIARKISGGTRSKKGSKTKFILTSLFGTWKLQNKNPFHECLNLLTSVSTNQPIPSLVSEV